MRRASCGCFGITDTTASASWPADTAPGRPPECPSHRRCRHTPRERFTPRVVPSLRATRDEVFSVATGESDAQLLETQRDKTYALRDRDIANARRLSGNLLLEDARGGRVAPAEKLTALVDSLALDRHKRTIVSCGSGVSASGAYLALLEAGFSDVAVYDGSWMEWSHDQLPTVAKLDSRTVIRR